MSKFIYGVRADLLIEADSEEDYEAALEGMTIEITNSEGKPMEVAQLLIAEDGPWYVIDKNTNETVLDTE